MSAPLSLRARARRYRLLAQSYEGAVADGLRASAEALERQAAALDAYMTAAHLGVPHRVDFDA